MRGRRFKVGVDTDKLVLLERFGSQMLATARRYSANSQDAEDAYQRASEILLTHDPSGSDDDLCRWLRTTVKHEALAIRRRQDRVLPSGPPERVHVNGVNPADTEARAESFERLRQGAQALGRLKPQEVRCLRLRAEGYSYQEICELTGFSYTKVNRSLTEGRRAFSERLAAIETGAECERLEPAISAVADGEAGAAELAALRPHLRHCPACRGRLREYRAVPSRLAVLLPAGIIVPRGTGTPLRTALESTLAAVQDRAAALSERAHQGVELAAGQKVAAVATSAAIASGGGIAAERLATPPAGPVGKAPRVAKAPRPKHSDRPERRRAALTPAARRPTPDLDRVQPTPTPAQAPTISAPADTPSEFAPSGGTASAAPADTSVRSASPAPSDGRGGEFAP